MFLDIVFNFCCSKRQKNDQDTISQRSSKSDEDQFAERRRQELDLGKTELAQRMSSKPPSSIGSPTDNYLVLNTNPQEKKRSFEEDELLNDHNNNYNEHLSKTTYHQQGIQTLKKYKQNLIRSHSQEKIDQGIKKKIQKKPKEENKRVVKIWEPEEDSNLKKYYEQYNGNWHKIVQQMAGRNISQCSQRWRRINPIQSKQKWSFEEDQRLIKLVQEKGKNWTQISKDFNGRSGKQIRERYLNKLDPQLKFEPWTKEEDELVLKYYKEFGAKWSQVANQLKGRAENQVKNRFYSHIQKYVLGKQNPYQIVHNTGNLNDTNNMDVEYSDSSELNKHPHSENYSVCIQFDQSSFGSSTYTFSFYDDEVNYDFQENNNMEYHEPQEYHQEQFSQDFQEKVSLY